MSFIAQQFIFYLTIVLVLFAPGYVFLLAVFGRKKFSHLETLVISFGISIILVDFLMLILTKFFAITRFSLLVTLVISIAACLIFFFLRRKNSPVENNPEFIFSKNQTALIIITLFLTIFLKTAYLKTDMVPSTTDLGHHMYWSKVISETGAIPDYAKRDIVKIENDYTISDPQPISDFIIGEHLIFSAVNLISGLDFISYFPIIILALINIFSALALFILALRFFENHPRGKNIAILALIFIGPLFTIAPPQIKYASGGVIGNIIGNLFVPLAFYFVYRALKEKNNLFLMLAVMIAMGLFYTHHLTGLIFLLSLLLSLAVILAVNFQNLKSTILDWLKLFFSRPVILFLFFALGFLFFVYTPSYLTNRAIDTISGGPAKVEHQGLSLSEYKFVVGEPRMALGLIGLAFLGLILVFRKNAFEHAFLFGWTGIIILVSILPKLLLISLPSARVANYGSYPLAILAAFAATQIIADIKNRNNANNNFLDPKIFLSAFILLVAFFITSGFYDNSEYKERIPDFSKTAQTFHASRYLAGRTTPTDEVLADHIFITSDSWIKLFFARDYYFPFFRANLERYDNGIDKKEFCTLWMISTPLSEDAQKCYNDLNLNFVIVNKKMDAAQFEKSSQFWPIYTNEELTVFYRNK